MFLSDFGEVWDQIFSFVTILRARIGEFLLFSQVFVIYPKIRHFLMLKLMELDFGLFHYEDAGSKREPCRHRAKRKEAMKAAFCTLGCKVNQYETEILQKQFREDGFLLVPPEEEADVYVVNSCTVTSAGDKKTRQLLRQFRRRNPQALIALTGCYPQAFPDEAGALPEADLVTGTYNRRTLLADIREVLASRERKVHILPHTRGEPFEPMQADRLSEHTRAFVKIEDGCDRYCSYCIIPKARGPIRSKELCHLREELEALAANGYREVVLVGINLSSYGRDTGTFRLADAVELACSVEGIERVRLGSLEPELLTEEDLDRLAALPGFCPQFHLSLQSGCTRTLRRMNRHYTAEEYAGIVGRIRARFENPSITTDLMVGFAGETEEEFEESRAFAEQIGFAKIHVFAYSVREGTRAASFPDQVPSEEKGKRSKAMMETAARLRAGFLDSQKGTVQEVLFERRRSDGMWTGYTQNYTPVLVPGTAELGGCIKMVELGGRSGDACAGRIKE